ncbi:hypothetical protein evm_010957 [Chilo suppressalis]|nr:hypothetical protein evm_010957 [Chilo suppressalis]
MLLEHVVTCSPRTCANNMCVLLAQVALFFTCSSHLHYLQEEASNLYKKLVHTTLATPILFHAASAGKEGTYRSFTLLQAP